MKQNDNIHIKNKYKLLALPDTELLPRACLFEPASFRVGQSLFTRSSFFLKKGLENDVASISATKSVKPSSWPWCRSLEI